MYLEEGLSPTLFWLSNMCLTQDQIFFCISNKLVLPSVADTS